MSRASVSVVIPTLDEEPNIAACLDSLSWADEVLVVDCGSRDRTAAIAAAHGARVLEHGFEGYGAQRNWAAERARHAWLMALDADERVSPRLAAQILELAARGFDAAAYSIPRRSCFAGRLIRHGGWQRDRVTRLYHRERARFNQRLVHESLVVDGPTRRLEGWIEHQTYRSFDQYMRKVERYAEAGARQLWSEGRRARPGDLALRPLGRFLRMYILQVGWLDGTAGFMLASVAAWGVFARYARLRELAAPDAAGRPAAEAQPQAKPHRTPGELGRQPGPNADK